MSKLTRWTIGFVLPLCFVAVAMMQGITEASQPKNGLQSSLKTYRDVDGQTYFALSLRPGISQTQQSQRDILLLVDTSASQTGLFREDSLEAVNSFVSGLREEERVHIMAIDLKVVPMTKGFVAADSKELAKGLARLKARTPLGATDLVGGLNAAIDQFKSNNRARSIVYIGDGMSRANAIALDELEPLVQKLTDNRVSINSFAIGVRRDLETLAVLANNSGGSLYMDGPAVTAQEAGVATLQLARGTVVWPQEVNWPAAVTQSYPSRVPPLRFDRDTILIGTLVGKQEMALRITADVMGKSVALGCDLNPEDTSIDDYAMVPELVSMARKTDGMMLPLLGTEGLVLARQSFQASSDSLGKLGKQALARGDIEGGVELLREALRRDPGNSKARVLLESNTSVRQTSTKGIVAQLEEDPFGDLGGDDADPFGGDDAGADPFGDAGDDPFGGDEDMADDNPLLIEDEEETPVLEPAEVEPTPAEVLPETPTEVPADLTLTPDEVPAPTADESATAPPAVVDYGLNSSPLVMSGDGQSDQDLLMSAEDERELQEQVLRTEVTRMLSSARDILRTDPAGALQDLKNLRETIVQTPDLSSGVRSELLDRLEVGLRQATRARIEKDSLDEAARANLAALDARRRLLAADVRLQQKVQQYLDQINALIDEGRFELAEEVALKMRDEAPRMVAPTVAVAKTGHLGNYRRMRELAELSARRWNDALYQVELSHIPFPDDPPIAYPPKEEWGPLSERRKAQYSKFDLGETGPAE